MTLLTIYLTGVVFCLLLFWIISQLVHSGSDNALYDFLGSIIGSALWPVMLMLVLSACIYEAIRWRLKK